MNSSALIPHPSSLAPKGASARYFLKRFRDLPLVFHFKGNVGHRNNAREFAVLIYDRNAADLFVAHQSDRFKDEIVGLYRKYLAGHRLTNARIGPAAVRDRTDDDVAVLKHRLEEFNAKTQPLAEFYESLGALRRIDGNRERDLVFADISRLIEQTAS